MQPHVVHAAFNPNWCGMMQDADGMIQDEGMRDVDEGSPPLDTWDSELKST